MSDSRQAARDVIPSTFPDGVAPEALIRALLETLGEDASREGLLKTPARVIASLRYLTEGYTQDVDAVLGDAFFTEAYDEMVVVRDIEVFSLCEHHLLPFFGRAHIAYLPRERIVGLSKIPRLVDCFARRLQVQERLTTQIAETLMDKLDPLGVAVVIEARHLCMVMRGVEKQNSSVITSHMLGKFRDDPRTRGEFMTLIAARPGA